MTQRGEEQIEKLCEEATCPACEYSLRGLPGEVVICPECGQTIDIVQFVTTHWDGSWHQVPTFKTIRRPAYFLALLMFVMLFWFITGGAQNHKAFGLSVTCFMFSLWVWQILKMWQQYKRVRTLMLSLLAHLVIAGYMIGVLFVLQIVLLFIYSTTNMLGWMSVPVFAAGIVILGICQYSDKLIASECVRLYLLEQANLISSSHEHRPCPNPDARMD